MTKSTKLFYAAFALVALIQLSKFIFPSKHLKQFHLNSSTFIEWAVLQSVPSMYNYSNRIWLSPDYFDPLTLEEIVRGDFDFDGIQMNHYPARVLTFRMDRKEVLGDKIKSVYMRSKFAGEIRFSVYSVSDGGELKLEKVHVTGR